MTNVNDRMCRDEQGSTVVVHWRRLHTTNCDVTANADAREKPQATPSSTDSLASLAHPSHESGVFDALPRADRPPVNK